MDSGGGGLPPWRPPPPYGAPYGIQAPAPTTPAPVAAPYRSALGAAGVHAVQHAAPPPGYLPPPYAPSSYPLSPPGGMVPPPQSAHGGPYGPWPGPAVPPPSMAPFPGPSPTTGAAPDPKLDALRQRRMMMRQQRQRALEAAQSMVMQAVRPLPQASSSGRPAWARQPYCLPPARHNDSKCIRPSPGQALQCRRTLAPYSPLCSNSRSKCGRF